MAEEKKYNTTGRVDVDFTGTYQEHRSFIYVDRQQVKNMDDEDLRIARTTGKLQGYTKFRATSEGLYFRCDAPAFPELWFDGTIKWKLITDGNTAEPMGPEDLIKIQGRTATVGARSELYARLQDWTLRVDDRQNLPFWAEVVVPEEYR